MMKTIGKCLIVCLAGAMLFASAACNRARGSAEKKPPTAKVVRGDLEISIDATGSVESNLDVEIKSKASGTVTTLPFDVSNSVPKYNPAAGNEDRSLLVALDPVDEQHRVDQAQAAVDGDEAKLQQTRSGLAAAEAELRASEMEAHAALTSADARLAEAKVTYERVKSLFERKVGGRDELDAALTQYKIAQADHENAQAKSEALKAKRLQIELRRADVLLAKANLKSSRVALADAQQRLADTKIYAPISGVITRREVEIGQIVASGIANVGGGTSMMTISDMSRMFVKAGVDESDIGRLQESAKTDQSTTITTDAYPGKRFNGRVVSITPRGNSESNVVTYSVKIEILSKDKRLLLPKMTTDVKILANRKAGVLLVPNNAVHYDKEQSFVELVKGESTERRNVTLGLNDGAQAEVLDGLSAGDVVALTASTTRWSNEGKSASQSPAGEPGKK